MHDHQLSSYDKEVRETRQKEALHPITCQGTSVEVAKMKHTVRCNPKALRKPQMPSSTDYFRPTCWEAANIFPIHDAAWMQHKDCVAALLEMGEDINLYTDTKMCRIGELSVLECSLLSKENIKDKYELIQFLLEKNASPNHTAFDEIHGYTYALNHAILNNLNDIANLLLEHNACVEDLISVNGVLMPRIDNCETPLTTSIVKWNVEAFRMLLLHGASMYFTYPKHSLERFNHIPISVLNPEEENQIIPLRELMINQRFGPTTIPHWIIQYTYQNIVYRRQNPKVASAQALQFLKIYQEFGGNLSIREPPYQHENKDIYNPKFDERYRENESVMEFLIRSLSIAESMPDLVNELMDMTHTPLTLQSLCRNSIRMSMGRDYWKNIKFLPIPNDIKTFLKHVELIFKSNTTTE